MPMIWYGDTVTAEINKEVGQRIKKAGIALRMHARQKVGRDQPTRTYGTSRTTVGLDPSKPGDYPKKVTAHLRRNIQAEYDPRIQTSRIGTNVPYGKWLELGTSKMARRPWLSRALAESMGQLRAILGRG